MIARSIRPGCGEFDSASLSTSILGEQGKRDTVREQLARTPSLLPLSELLSVVAEQPVPLLLTGETGAGKTWLARIIHDCSPWRHEPFVTVACGALPPQLVESEFFGHVRGAFTGADHSRVGRIAAAGRGTLLFDEIDTLSLEQQAKLLRVLDSGEYEPLGSNETRQRACRIMAASNADLIELIHSGEFRSDLYYRLHVLPLHLPPLRERTQDIGPLAKDLASRYATEFGKKGILIAPETLSLLESYSWPGNLRELDNVIRHSVLLSGGTVLLPRHLPESVREGQAVARLRSMGAEGLLRDSREAAERTLIRKVLADSGHSRSLTAKRLGISRATLHKKMKEYRLASE